MDLTGQKLGKYELVKYLGRGGMAEVYQAFQPTVERLVAVKILHRHIADNENFVERFKREAKGMGKLHHPNIVRLIDFDVDQGDYYIVLEYIPGGTLRHYLDQHGALPPHQTLHIMAQLTDAVAYAHQQQIIHRDIKPDNVMLSDETARHVLLMDFGLARLQDGTNITNQGTVIGTAAYISPEVLDGQPADERSDIYSLGILFYQLLTGSTPYHANSAYEMMLKQINEPLPPPREKNPNISPQMEALVLKALQKDPNNRFQSAREFHLAVTKMLMPNTGELGSSPPPPPPPPENRTRRRDKSKKGERMKEKPNNPKPILAVIGGVFLAAFVTVLVLLLVPVIMEDTPPTVVAGGTTESTPVASASATFESPPVAEAPATPENTAISEASPEAPVTDQAASGVFRFVDNSTVQAGDIALQINQIAPAPEGSHYELLLLGQNSETVLNLGEFPVQNDQVNFTYSSSENLLATYHKVMVNLVSNDGSAEALIVLVGSLDDQYIEELRDLIVNEHSKGFLPKVIEQSKLASQQMEMLQNALQANNLAEAKRYAELLVNILEGEEGQHYGDLNGDGQIENPGDGFGVQKYLRGIQGQTRRVMSSANMTGAQRENANQLMVLSEEVLSASDISIDLALQLLAIETIDDNTMALAGQLEWYVLELLEGPDLDRETGGMIAAYKYGLRLAEVLLFPSS